MTFIDAIIVVLLLWAMISGLRQGLIVAGLSLIGAVAGAFLAIRLAPLLTDQLAEPGAKVAVGIACIIVGVGIGELAGSFLGRQLSDKVTWRPAVVVDRILGLVGHTLAVLIVTWMVALPLAAAPIPWLSTAVRGSGMLKTIDKAMPEGAQVISAALGRALGDSGFPSILEPLAKTPLEEVPEPDPALAKDPVVQRVRGSILKVLAPSTTCNRGMEGTGWVIGKERVMTNAHVVAGSTSTVIEVGDTQLRASVVFYDPNTDLAVLKVPGLSAPSLPFVPTELPSGDGAIIAGYPLNGPFTPVSARISTAFELRGPDIYATGTVRRQVYTLRGVVLPGNSGGPLLNPKGEVVGVIFGNAPDISGVGYALTGAEVADEVAAGKTDDTPAATGNCLPKD